MKIIENNSCIASEDVQNSASMSNEGKITGTIPEGDLASETVASVEPIVEADAKIIAFPAKKEIASESGHWYLPDGTPFYTVPRRSGPNKGEPRPVSLAHDRKIMTEKGAVPSVTTITGILDKPGLNYYHERNIFQATLDCVREVQESMDDYFDRVRATSKDHSRKAAERGTALHGEIERFLRGELIQDKSWLPHIAKLVLTLTQYGINIREGAPEKSFAHRMGFGGKVDWNCGGLRGEPTVLDFKSKESIDDKKLRQWCDSGKSMQLAAYREGLLLPNARCINIFVGQDDTEIRIFEWPQSGLNEAWEKFTLLLRFWKKEHHYYPKLQDNDKPQHTKD